MRILLIHNNYGVYSGEEAVVDRQIALFEELGHSVSQYRKTTEGSRGTLAGNVKGVLQGIYSPSSVRDIKKLMRTDRPDVVVIHNLYPYISPAILKPIREAGVPIVMTVHNFRLICPTGLFMRDSVPCEQCLNVGNEWPCIRYNCEHSYLKSLGYAGRNWYARITSAYKEHVTSYACITRFQIQKLIQAGFPESRMVHIPNFVDDVPEPDYALGDYVAISGRMSREKGIDLVLEVARQTPDVNYRFAGSVRPEDQSLFVDIPDNCRFVGHLSKDQLKAFYLNSRFLVVASRWYEGFPMTILDASMYGKASIGPAHAGFLEIIENNKTGLHFTPNDVNDLKDKIRSLWSDPDKPLRMGKAAFLKLQNNYTVAAVKAQWNELLNGLVAK